MKKDTLKQMLGKAAYKSFIDFEIRTLRKLNIDQLTDRQIALAYGRKAPRDCKVDFIHNHYSPYLPR